MIIENIAIDQLCHPVIDFTGPVFFHPAFSSYGLTREFFHV